LRDVVLVRGVVIVVEVVELFGVLLMMVRCDLVVFSRSGVVRWVYGGAVYLYLFEFVCWCWVG